MRQAPLGGDFLGDWLSGPLGSRTAGPWANHAVRGQGKQGGKNLAELLKGMGGPLWN